MPEEPALSRGERTRQNVKDAAYSLFLEQGYAATSMRQIADKTGLALGGIYNHFANKEAIFTEIIIDHHPYKHVLPIILRTPTDNVESFVRKAAETMVNELGRRPDFIKLMMIEMVEFNGRNMPKILSTVFPEILPAITHLSNIPGKLRKIPPGVLFRAFLGMFFSYYLTEMVIAGTPFAMMQENALEHFVDIFLHGVLKERS